MQNCVRLHPLPVCRRELSPCFEGVFVYDKEVFFFQLIKRILCRKRA